MVIVVVGGKEWCSRGGGGGFYRQIEQSSSENSVGVRFQAVGEVYSSSSFFANDAHDELVRHWRKNINSAFKVFLQDFCGSKSLLIPPTTQSEDLA